VASPSKAKLSVDRIDSERKDGAKATAIAAAAIDPTRDGDG
jgi:hypothetical protein